MNAQTTTHHPTPIFFLVLFLFAVIGLGYLATRQHDAYITLTINNEWHLYLMGDGQIDDVKYHVGRFSELRHDNRRLWLRGEGEIHWLKNVIRVHKAGVYVNNKLLTRFFREKTTDITVMHNGTAHKGAPPHDSAN